jgi:hypothetical protein
MRLSTHSLEEVCSAIRDLDRDFQGVCPVGDGTPGLRPQLEHED